MVVLSWDSTVFRTVIPLSMTLATSLVATTYHTILRTTILPERGTQTLAPDIWLQAIRRGGFTHTHCQGLQYHTRRLPPLPGIRCRRGGRLQQMHAMTAARIPSHC